MLQCCSGYVDRPTEHRLWIRSWSYKKFWSSSDCWEDSSSGTEGKRGRGSE